MNFDARSQRLGLKAWTLAALCILSAASAQVSPSAAQAWPQRTIALIVSQSAGASPDVMARLVADRLANSLKQPVIVENKPGGGNVIGAQAAARAAPDGYTFFFATSAALVTNPFMMKALPYDPLKDFVPVALITRSHQIIVVNPNVAAKTLPDLIALEKAAPGKMSIAVDGQRNLAGVIGQALNKRAGTSLVAVNYPNINTGLQDVAVGRVEVGVFSVSTAEAFVRDGRLRIIAGASSEKVGAFPEVAAVAETLPGFDFLGWFMVMAPAGTPPEIVAQMNAALENAVRDEKVRDMAPKLGFELSSMGLGGPDIAAKFLKDQMALWGTTTRELGIEPQ